MLSKIPPRSKSKGNSRAGSSDPQGPSASQPTTGRQTYNSIRAGQSSGLPITNKESSQDLTVIRREQRIAASRAEVIRRSSLSNPDISPTTNFPNSNLPSIPEIDMTPPAGTTAAGTSGTSASASGNQNPATDPNVTMAMTTRKMPKPGEKNAPTFDPEKPEELGRFFERMADWFADEHIDSDVEQKRRIVRYLDTDSELQWKALSKFTTGTFADFKAQVMASYPKAEEVMKGSVTALKQKIKKLGPVAADERDELLSLIRVMTAEVLKLKRISPPIHTNRELVELFLGRLTPDFASRVAGKLSVHRLINVPNPEEEAITDRNPEDMYDIEEVMTMAKHTSLEQGNPFGKYLLTGPSGGTEVSVKLEEAVARLTDSITLQSQYNKQMDQRFASLQNFVSQPKLPAAQPGFNRALVPPSNHVAPNYGNCFYCGGPHRVAGCEDALRHLDLGWIKKVEGYLRLPDGQKIPREANKTLKEFVEALNKVRPGIIPMSKIQDKSGFMQEAGSAASFVQTGQNSEDETMRALVGLIQRVGVDKVQRLITSQGSVEEEEWDQNFD